ncbi:MAG: glutathione S-transferase C-terminal domain-containing protein [Alphaproteobacteria bacterium]
MIDLYSWPTPNGHKIHILLEELGLEYQVHGVDISAGEQFDPDFLAISPNNRIPAIIDQDGPDGEPLSVFESGAIMIYLAEKCGRFLPQDPRGHSIVMQWLMFQMSSVGPMLGQATHFRQYAPPGLTYAVNKFTNDGKRLLGVLDRRLAAHPWLAGKTYTIADMAVFPWIRGATRRGQNREDFPNLKRWYELIKARPAVMRGVAVLADRRQPGPLDARAQDMLFGAGQNQRR